MRFIVFVKATKDSEAGALPGEELLTEMNKFNEALVAAGVMEAGEGLHSSANGARVNFSGEKRTVTKGPFADPEQLVAGFWIWNVKSLDEAIEWAKRCPNPSGDKGVLELRQIFESEDFGDTLPPEVREAEARMRAQLATKH